MVPLPPLGTLYRLAARLWVALDGPNAMRLHRLLTFVFLGVMLVGAYWAMATKDVIDHHLERLAERMAERDAQWAERLGNIDGRLTTVENRAFRRTDTGNP